MALRSPDPHEQKLLDAFKHFDDRDLRWLWETMRSGGYRLPKIQTVPPSKHWDSIQSALFGGQDPAGQIKRLLALHTDRVIGKDVFDWFGKDDERLLLWLLGRPTPAIPTAGPTPLAVPRETRRDRIILMIDCVDVTPDQKRLNLEATRKEWNRRKTPDKYTKWLNPKDEEQLKWAWSYLTKASKAFPIPVPITPSETFVAVLAALDRMSDGHPAEKQLFLDKMRKTWSQKKYRDSEGARKQFYLGLNKQAIKDLKYLANERQLKASEIVEQLLAKEIATSRGS